MSFWLYTREDLDRIRAVAEVEGRSLAAAMLERRAEFDAIIERIPQPGADPAALAFFLIGCACLDWDGLRVTVEEGYRTSPGPDGFLPEALEPGGGGSRRGLYWGSHNEMGTVTLTTFGDHHSTRYGFPDLVGWRVKTALAASEIPATLGSRITGLLDDFLFEEIGEVMLELRAGDRTREELALAAGLSPEVADRLLALLVEMDYVHEGADGRFTARIPVLAGRDSEAVVELRRLGQGVIGEWLAERHGALREELSDLTAVRHGVPLADGFYWIWHYLFGVANRELVAAGWLADPYAAERRFKGYIPAVFHHTSLANGPLPEAP